MRVCGMRTGISLTVTPADRHRLEAIARDHNTPQKHVLRAASVFLDAIEAEVPVGKIVHVILDNYGAHKHSKTRAWLDRHPRFSIHYTPTSASRLNAVEGYFATLTKTRLKRGAFRSILALQVAITCFIAETNHAPKPFVWTADPNGIGAAVKPGSQVLGSLH